MDKNNIVTEIKDYWNNQPCGVKKGQGDIGTLEYFKTGSERRYKVEPHLRDFAGFHQWRGKRVLEIGCGMGWDAVEFAKHGAHYVGVDISEDSVKLAKQQFEAYGLEGEFHVLDAGDSEALKQLGEFDLVYSMGVIHHYPDIRSTIKNIHQCVANDGEFRFMVYAKDSWKYAMIQKGLDQFEAQSDCPYAEAFTRDDMYKLLDGYFDILRLRQAHCFMYNIDMYKQGKHELEPWFEAMPEEMREAVSEYLGWHLLVKAKKSHSASYYDTDRNR